MAVHYVAGPNHATKSRAILGTSGNAGTFADPKGLEEAYDDIVASGAGGDEIRLIGDSVTATVGEFDLDSTTALSLNFEFAFTSYVLLTCVDENDVAADNLCKFIYADGSTGAHKLRGMHLQKVSFYRTGGNDYNLYLQSSKATECVFDFTGLGATIGGMSASSGGSTVDITVFEGCTFQNYPGTSDYLMASGGGGTVIRNCLFDNCGRLWAGTGQKKGSMMSGCRIINSVLGATQLFNVTGGLSVTDTYINANGNTVFFNGGNETGQMTVTGCTFEDVNNVWVGSYDDAHLQMKHCIAVDVAGDVFATDQTTDEVTVIAEGCCFYNVTGSIAEAGVRYISNDIITTDPVLDASGIPTTPIQLASSTVIDDSGTLGSSYKAIGYGNAEVTGGGLPIASDLGFGY